MGGNPLSSPAGCGPLADVEDLRDLRPGQPPDDMYVFSEVVAEARSGRLEGDHAWGLDRKGCCLLCEAYPPTSEGVFGMGDRGRFSGDGECSDQMAQLPARGQILLLAVPDQALQPRSPGSDLERRPAHFRLPSSSLR